MEGKVMSYEDIKEAQAKRAAKDATKGKGTRDRKRKMTALEANELDVEADAEPAVAHATKESVGMIKRGRKPKIVVQTADNTEPELEPEPEPEVAQMIEAPKPFRAPVARMI
ncbi:hypothetical protein BKA64DRAFT_777226 [Cadophora sp. MPI-SDFR-AT-0126]|nr:hypothetical protein BKA64DRAFT_777226 [Leotiomycetes sp. MPI-SDFR-AT-0126]